MSSLLIKQQLFTRLVVKLIQHANELGYELTMGEAWRPDATAKFYEEKGIGSKNSLHRIRLAIDLQLFKNGEWLKETEDHRPLGEFWEKLSTEDCECAWGGRWGDGNHYSVAHQSMR